MDDDPLIVRILGEFREMPGLCVTRAQAQRLWGVDEPTCQRVLDQLTSAGAVRVTADGRYISNITDHLLAARH